MKWKKRRKKHDIRLSLQADICRLLQHIKKNNNAEYILGRLNTLISNGQVRYLDVHYIMQYIIIYRDHEMLEAFFTRYADCILPVLDTPIRRSVEISGYRAENLTFLHIACLQRDWHKIAILRSWYIESSALDNNNNTPAEAALSVGIDVSKELSADYYEPEVPLSAFKRKNS